MQPNIGLDRLLGVALDTAPIGLIALNGDGGVRLLTGGASRLLGLETGREVFGMGIGAVLALCPSVPAGSAQALGDALAYSDGEPSEILLRVAGRRIISVDIRPAGLLGWVLSLEDVTRTRQTQDWLLEHASSDPVTGRWNRQHFLLMLRDRLGSMGQVPVHPDSRSHALMMIGLQRFKQASDLLGLGAADTILRLVAERLSGELREDDLLARFAGEAFALFVTREGHAANLEAFAERIFSILSAPYMVDGQVVTLGAHIGIACAPVHGVLTEDLVAHSALALQETTTRGTAPICFFEPALTERARLRRALEADLRLALVRGEFELHYQPQVDVRRNCVTGLEALIRWRNPERGLVSPAEFIPLAEQTGLIVEIGDWVLHEACREAEAWPAEVTVAVNASPLQFETGSFAQSVADVLRKTGLAASRLEIEITESLLLRDTGTVMGTLAALHALGVRLVLDDFGTGYASLSQLSRFRFDKIKIDRSFVSPKDASLENSAIVRSIAALGVSLAIPTTAEGVETAKQLEQIKADGCTCVQGYYFSRPVPAKDVGALLTRLNQAEVSQAA